MSDLGDRLQDLAEKVGGVRAALVTETSGIEVATWGQTDFETAAAELAELWRQVDATETCATPGSLQAIDVLGTEGAWVVLPLGTDYMLALLCDPGVAPGKARFYSTEWVLQQRGDFV